MDIQIRLSAGLAYATGQTRLTVTLDDGAHVCDAIATVEVEQPTLQGRLQRALPMLGGRHVAQDTPLYDGAELLLLLPAAGGMNGAEARSVKSIFQRVIKLPNAKE